MENLGTTALTVLLCTGLVLTTLVCWAATLIGLPGNWGILLVAIGYDWLLSDGSPRELGFKALVALAVLAALGELVEFLAGSLGVARKGGSATSATLALVGSILGALVGGFVSLPIPVIGPLVGVLLGSSLGAMLGAMLGEDARGRHPRDSLGVGWAAFWSRLAGTLGKTLIGAVMVAVVIMGLIF